MDKAVIRSKIEGCFLRLQHLDISPTVTNMERLLQTEYDLREIYNMMGSEDDGRAKADSE